MMRVKTQLGVGMKGHFPLLRLGSTQSYLTLGLKTAWGAPGHCVRPMQSQNLWATCRQPASWGQEHSPRGSSWLLQDRPCHPKRLPIWCHSKSHVLRKHILFLSV